jgi:hypothetical protein
MKTVIWIILIVVIVVQIIRWIIDRMEGKPRNRRANDWSDSSDYGYDYDSKMTPSFDKFGVIISFVGIA